MGTWNAYANEDWPADYLIDANGQVRYTAVGEGDYDKTETAIRALLAEAGDRSAARATRPAWSCPPKWRRRRPIWAPTRAEGWVDGPGRGLARLRAARPASLKLNEFAFSGTWNISGQPAEAVAGAGIDLEFNAKNVYLVLSSPGERPLPVQVLLDGHPISASRRRRRRARRRRHRPPPAAVLARLAAGRSSSTGCRCAWSPTTSHSASRRAAPGGDGAGRLQCPAWRARWRRRARAAGCAATAAGRRISRCRSTTRASTRSTPTRASARKSSTSCRRRSCSAWTACTTSRTSASTTAASSRSRIAGNG